MSSFAGPTKQPLSAATVRSFTFDTVRRHGLDPAQVSVFVDRVCESLSELSRQRDEAVARLDELSERCATVEEELTTAVRQRDTASDSSAALGREVAELRERLSRSPGEAAAEVLMLAHEAAASTAERAAEAAAVQAERIIAEADAESERRRLAVATELAGRVARVEYLTRVETELCGQLTQVADTVRAQLSLLPGLGSDALHVLSTVPEANTSGSFEFETPSTSIAADAAIEASHSLEDLSVLDAAACADDEVPALLSEESAGDSSALEFALPIQEHVRSECDSGSVLEPFESDLTSSMEAADEAEVRAETA